MQFCWESYCRLLICATDYRKEKDNGYHIKESNERRYRNNLKNASRGIYRAFR